MPTIDADTHVSEHEQTWDYLEGEETRFRPELVTINPGSDERKFWIIEGEFYPDFRTVHRNSLYPPGTRELIDVDARLRHMDQLGVDVQVLIPSFWLGAKLRRPEVQLALTRSYNRWLADTTSRAKGRLRWIMIPPLMSMDQAVADLDFAKRHGACGVFTRGIELERILSDLYFFPLYEKASQLDMPICVHVGNSAPLPRSAGAAVINAVLPVISAFYSLYMSDVPERFPRLRFAFLEASCQWVPFALREAARAQIDGARRDQPIPPHALRDRRFYVSCQMDDDLPYVLRYVDEDNLVYGTDYGHADIGTDIEGQRVLRGRADIDPLLVRKLVYDNAAALYGL